MTRKAMKLLLKTQAKPAIWFLCIYPLVILIIFAILKLNKNNDFEWIGVTTISAPKIYLLVMGIVYPLVTTGLFISRGLTRKQYFWAFTGAISILSIILLLPSVITEIILGTISPISVIMNLVQLPLYFLFGWTAAVGFQFGRWQTSFLGILCTVGSIQLLNFIDVFFHWPMQAQLGASFILIAILIKVLPNIVSKVPIKY